MKVRKVRILVLFLCFFCVVSLAYAQSSKVDVTLKYLVRDDHRLVSCSVWSDVFGGGVLVLYDTNLLVKNGEVNEFVVNGVPPGTYRWRVSCVDDAGRPSSLANALNGYWTFRVKAPEVTTSSVPTSTTLPHIIAPDSDVVLVMDLSPSMQLCFDGSGKGCDFAEIPACPNDPPHANGCSDADGMNPVRWELAQRLGKEFVDRVLSRPNNRIALVGFAKDVGSSPPFAVGLTGDVDYLKHQVDSYYPSITLGLGTSTCAGLRRARNILEAQSDPSKNKYIVILSDGMANGKCDGSYPSMSTTMPDLYCCAKSCSGMADPTQGCVDPGVYALNTDCDCSKATGGWKDGCKDYYDLVAIKDARDDACAAKAAMGSKLQIYSVGTYTGDFVSGCQWGKGTLDGISACGGGKTFVGTSTTELEEIYQKF